ncbi:tetratricopeptide repeat protein [Suttonella ornithocola]|uniref:Cytochrome c biogenesis factor n=1 Tax=Suttonella ornithocola TaxID=279832 RepID=A0A380MW48_9GAMM|nr:hypothetical protein [Suttonella ornithocola]SUO96404.1 Cytochrome c biogenesis factor [Suttonella ornithocola]
MFIILTIITLILFLYLFAGKPLKPYQPEAEARALIAQYDEQTTKSDKEEREKQLYYELSAILKGRGRAVNRLPFITLPLTIIAFSLAGLLWYQQGGENALRWQQLNQTLKSDIRQSQFYGAQMLQNSAALSDIFKHIKQSQFFDQTENQNALLLYCQALQRQLDRQDITQLQALGSCYNAIGAYPLSAPVYDRLVRLQPEDPATILEWAQANILAEPDRPISDNIQQALQALVDKQPDNLLATLFLASAYQQRGELTKSRPLWERLQKTIPKNDPLYQAVSKAMGDNTHSQSQVNQNYQIQITIAPEMLAKLDSHAKLYLIAAPQNQKMPIAVKALTPAEHIDTTLNNSDTMRGENLGDYAQLAIRAKLSPNGKPDDSQALEVSSPAQTDRPIKLTFH